MFNNNECPLAYGMDFIWWVLKNLNFALFGISADLRPFVTVPPWLNFIFRYYDRRIADIQEVGS